MKNLSLILNAVLAIAVIVLFVKVFSNNPKSPSEKAFYKNDSLNAGLLPIAYINVDSLLLNYQFAKEANESLIKKQEDSRLSINTKARQLQTEMSEFQRKLEANAFLSRERAEQEQSRLLKRQEDLRELDGQLSQQLMQVQQKMSEQLRDTINSFLKEYNKDQKYQLILSNTSSDNILYATEGLDITPEITDLLNKRYAAKK
ncbi:MAG: OmpH family outer membrane protein [Paludibacter sp.]|nr:OmpH family outer membrane protein [Paludibacter sp.]MBP6355817.1 OmpH family outer membrane protein [Paludibacter sp.]MBP6634597.1 OmpH family outer membrane protein [Paludibacter sp.]